MSNTPYTAANFTADRREVLALGAGAAVASLAGIPAAATAATVVQPGGRAQPFDNDWRFHRGEGTGLEAAVLDDSGWRGVDLPHDWSIEDLPGATAPDQLGPFDKHAIGGTATGFAVGGEGWYRKRFRVGPADARVEVLFDGVQGECDAWLNGTHLGTHHHTYAPFALDLTPALNRAGDNVLALRVRNLGKHSRWYSGAGLTRQVTLDVLPAGARLARWGVGAWTRRFENGLAEIDVTTRIDSADPALILVTRLRDAAGTVVAEARGPAVGEAKQTLRVRGPRLWSPDAPNLHALETELRRGDTVVDRITQDFGIRIVTMDATRGLQINGSRVVLRGGCIHHDNGLLGACAYPDADERRIALLKARGYNAIRSSHNPASRSLRSACDRLGMLMVDEAFDMWHVGKNPDDYHLHFPTDWEVPLTAMVQSARNNPCVIMWSIGNEIPERSSPAGIEWEWKLANAVRRLDPTRPVTAALNGLLGPLVKAGAQTARPGKAGQVDNAAAVFLDVVGYNYRLDDIEKDYAAHPDRVVFGTETFPRDAWDYRELAARAPYMLGEFVWTAMDYLGEAGIGQTTQVAATNKAPFVMGAWPWNNAWCGDIDLIGGQKPPSLYRDVVWGVSPLEMMVQRPIAPGMREAISNWGWADELPSWSWAGNEGKPMAVRLYTPGDRVELLLNGVKVGEAALPAAAKLRAEITVAYAPGVLEAVAYSGGRVIARKRLETAGPAARLRLRAERVQAAKGRQGLAYLGIEVVDAAGRVLPEDQRALRLAISGPAELAGFGSANPKAVGSFQSPRAQSFRGRALAILRGRGSAGIVRVTASADGLPAASTTVHFA
ncbi:MAG: DUF4982 domain-containing protein [Sphingomonadales bacterium]|nr:DUF4982 domain-containing protein [Sphingomonadales bacterium]